MAIQVGGTTVITNNQQLQSVNGLKTINGSSILGTGNISISGGTSMSISPNASNSTFNNNQGGSNAVKSNNHRFGNGAFMFVGTHNSGNYGNPSNTNGNGNFNVNGTGSWYVSGGNVMGYVNSDGNLQVTSGGSHGFSTLTVRGGTV